MVGRILGVDNTPTSTVASGIWALQEQFRWISEDLWPATSISLADIILVESGAGMTDNGTINFANSLEENDVVIIAYIGANTSAVSITTSGYVDTLVAVLTGNTSDPAHYAYKVMGATPDTGFTFSGITGGADGLAYAYYVLKNVDTTNVFDVTPTTSTSEDPPAITTATAGSWAIPIYFGSGGGAKTVTSAPTGYSNLEWFNATANSDVRVAISNKAVDPAGLEDPGQYSTSLGTDKYTATLAIRPGPIVAGSFGIASYYYFETASSSNLVTLDAPEFSPGDLLLAFVFATDSRSITTPSGWTLEETAPATGNTRGAFYSRVAQTGDTSWTWDFSDLTTPGGAIINCGLAQLNSFTTIAGPGGTGTSNFTVPSVTAPSGNNFDVIISGQRGYLSTLPTGFKTIANTVDGRSDLYMGLRRNVSSGSTGTTSTITCTDGNYSVARFIVSPYPTITFQNSSTSTIDTITLPSTNIQEGDIVILHDHAVNSITTSPTAVVPTGFTQISNFTGVIATREILSYKVITSGDIGSTITGMNGTAANIKIAAVFRGVDSSTLANITADGGNGVVTSQTISTNGVLNPTLAIAAGYTSSTYVLTQDTSPASTGNIQLNSGSRYSRFNYVIFNEAPTQNVTYTLDSGTYQTMATFYLTV